jgi:hypothetical protein
LYLSDLHDVWWRLVYRLGDVRDVLRVLVDDEEAIDVDASLSAALYHVGEAIKLLEIGTEEIHTLQACGVGAYRTRETDEGTFNSAVVS